jgi:hypothetical protein
MVPLIAIPPLVIILSSLLLGRLFNQRFPSRWWLLRLGLFPLICVGLACYVMATPTPIPDNYDPSIHGNDGRLDFLAIMAWGLVFPTIYLAIAFPASLAYALWKRRIDAEPD